MANRAHTIRNRGRLSRRSLPIHRIAAALTLSIAFASVEIGSAEAQSAQRQRTGDQRQDLLRSKRPGGAFPPATKQAETKTEPEQPFEFSIAGPFAYTTNANQTNDMPFDSWHGSPEVGLKWTHAFGGMTLALSGGVGFDRYTGHSELDSDTLSARANLQFPETALGLKPYLRYDPLVVFTPFFESKSFSLHKLVGGATKTLTFGPNNATTVTFNGSGGYQLSDVASIRAALVTASMRVVHPIAKDVEARFEPSAGFKFYSDDPSGSRRDITTSGKLALAWSLSDKWEVAAVFLYKRNFSTSPSAVYNLWDIGPVIGFTHKF